MIAILTAFLGAYAGADGTSLAWRRVGIPLVLIAYCGAVLGCFYKGLPLLGLVGVFSIGYGLPDKGDEGSFLGRLLKRDWAVRGFLALLISLLGLLVVIANGLSVANWLSGSALLVLVWMLFGGDDFIKGEGKVYILDKGLLIEDLILYGAVGEYISWLVR